ncbi:hypothetical protein MWH03_00180 [Klebsiella pneumoniae]|nr:hypothetical protein [Klebsiella pneumoniae]
MNLWQMLMARRGLMDVADNGLQGGGGGGGEAPVVDLNTPDDPKPADNPQPNDELDSLAPDELKARLKAINQEKAELLKETMKRKEKEKSLTATLAQYGGVDPERVKALLDAEAKAEQEKLAHEQAEMERRGEFDAVKKQMIEAHQAELNAERERVVALESELAKKTSTILEMTVGTAFAGSVFLRENALMTPNKARVVYGAHFEVGEDGQVVGYDKPAGAKDRAVLVDSHGNALDFEKAIERILRADPEADALLRSKARPGAGSRTEPKPTLRTPQGDKSTMDKLAAGLNKLKR